MFSHLLFELQSPWQVKERHFNLLWQSPTHPPTTPAPPSSTSSAFDCFSMHSSYIEWFHLMQVYDSKLMNNEREWFCFVKVLFLPQLLHPFSHFHILSLWSYSPVTREPKWYHSGHWMTKIESTIWRISSVNRTYESKDWKKVSAV